MNRLDTETARVRRRHKRDNGEVLPEPWERSAAKAFTRMLATGGGKPHARKADIVLVWHLDTGRGHLIGGGPISATTLWEQAKTASIKAVLHDGVNITTVAHYGQHMPAHLHTALSLGSPPEFEGVTCSGCGRRFHLEWDHVEPRNNGGAWSATNTDPKCWYCHVTKTEQDRQNGLLNPRGPREARAP
jgi:hypothetical protein